MKAFYSDIFEFPLPQGHRFPIQKYQLLRMMILERGVIPSGNLIIPRTTTDEEIKLVHTTEYLDKINQGFLSDKEIRRLGLPWSPQLVQRAKRSTGGTIQACQTALTNGIGINLSGGTHHAFADHAEGYCLLNDVAIAVRVLQVEGLINRAVIIDCDVHQGNGTACIFTDDPRVFTFSIHGEKNFPLKKEISNLDIALEDNTEDDKYLDYLAAGLETAIINSTAELAIYLAGADPYKGDRLGRLSLTKNGLKYRDRIVLKHCQEAGLPVAIVMAGGYAHIIQDTVDIHYQTICTAADLANQ
jgi:acetoin utilization deacetylase AcuC-like enzyme